MYTLFDEDVDDHDDDDNTGILNGIITSVNIIYIRFVTCGLGFRITANFKVLLVLHFSKADAIQFVFSYHLFFVGRLPLHQVRT